MSKKLHKTHDSFIKELLSYKESAAEFIKLALPPEVHYQFDLENITYLPGTYTTKELNEYISDILLKIPVSGSDGEVTVSILIEHKSSIDHFTCLQLLTYIANGYARQRKQDEKLSVIIPVIYYHGKGKWQFRSLKELFAGVPAEFRKFIPTFHTEMFTVSEYSLEQIHIIAEAKLRAALMLQKGQYDDMVAIRDYVRVINDLDINAPGNFLFTLFVYMVQLPKFEREIILDITNQLTTEMKTKSMTYYDQLKEEGRLEGRQEGIQQGSLEKGYEFARKLLLRNMPLEEICELTDLTMEEVKKLVLT